MFCPKCGNKLDDGGNFCAECGFNIKQKKKPGESVTKRVLPPTEAMAPQTALAGGTSGNQGAFSYGAELYSSKGYPTSFRNGSIFWGIAVILGGIACMFFSQARYSGSKISVYSGGRWEDVGTLGGGNVFTSDGQQTVMIIGIVMVLAGIVLLGMTKKQQESMALNLYENKITGVVNFQKFVLDYEQVTEVLSDSEGKIPAVTLITAGNKYRIIVSHGEDEAAEIIRNKSRQGKRGMV